MICYDGGMLVIFPLKTYLDTCAQFFSFILFGNCSLNFLGIEVPGTGVFYFDKLLCYIPLVNRLTLSNDCVIVFSQLIPSCSQ
jgi:hypothetical protein